MAFVESKLHEELGGPCMLPSLVEGSLKTQHLTDRECWIDVRLLRDVTDARQQAGRVIGHAPAQDVHKPAVRA